MQKILYLAHMFELGRTGNPLVHGSFEAWDYGPVHPELYHRAKIFGSDPVENIFTDARLPEEGTPECAIIDEAYGSLGNVGPGRLVNLTHRRGGAWETNYIPGARNIIIPNDDILKEYRELEDEHKRKGGNQGV
jgi:uncharacterized phage-associated protein